MIQRLKNPKDAEAWKQFYQFYWEVITGWAQRAGCDYARAQDIFQETMICLMRKLQKFDLLFANGCSPVMAMDSADYSQNGVCSLCQIEPADAEAGTR